MKPPFVVAEIGASHCGDIGLAMELIDQSYYAGADAVKLQTWSEMTVADFEIPKGPWKGRQLRDLYAECRTPWEWHKRLFERCGELGFMGFSTPFDEASVDFLESIGCPMYKIASFEITHLRLIRHAAATGKPVIISTGMATAPEIEEAVEAATTAGAAGITLLKCVSSYPAPLADFNLVAMAAMPLQFNCPAGLSDHTKGTTAAVVATAFGATMIEKHITIGGRGPDGGFASEPLELEAMVTAVRQCAEAVGEVAYGPNAAEQDSLILRRSLWVTRDLKAGDELTADSMAILRPALGAGPDQYEAFLGERVARDVPRGTPVTMEILR